MNPDDHTEFHTEFTVRTEHSLYSNIFIAPGKYHATTHENAAIARLKELDETKPSYDTGRVLVEAPNREAMIFTWKRQRAVTITLGQS